jgi:hypothetical protein
MDIRLYLRVIWRFRIVVALGLLLAIAFAFMSFVRVSFSGSPMLSYRETEDWQSATTFVISGPGFAVGSLQQAGGNNSPVALSGLAAFYARVAMSDDVYRLMLKDGPIDGVVTASPGVDNVTTIRAPLPLVSIFGDASSREKAVALARRGSRAFVAYIKDRQEAAEIPDRQRIQLRVINAAQDATLVVPRKKTLPIVIFLTIMTAAIGLAFILENLRPRVRPLSTLEDESRPTRRSA